jgi:hypothetical protein
MSLKCLSLILLFLGLKIASFAQDKKLFAHFPLSNTALEVIEQKAQISLINTKFLEGGTFTEGIYEDFDKQKGSAIINNYLSDWDLKDFSLSLFFKINTYKKMPIFMIGKSARLLAVNILEDGKFHITINNQDEKFSTNDIAKLNQWQEVSLKYQKNELFVYIDNKLIFNQKNIILNEQYVDSDVNISSVNFSNGQCFTGFWKDLKLFHNVSNSNSSEVIETNNTQTSKVGTWKKYEFEVNGKPSNDLFSLKRQFFSLKKSDNTLNVVWQDKTFNTIYCTNISKDFKKHQSVSVTVPKEGVLQAASIDEFDNVYLAVNLELKDSKGNDILTMYKIDKNGKIVLQKSYNSDKNNLDIFKIGYWTASMCYTKGSLVMMFARTMNKSSDGLNHQGGIAVIFDANTLEIKSNTGQTSGHSFDNFLTVTQQGEFIGIDLGDNYPRGINLHKIKELNRNSKVVYSFKTQHGTTPQSPAGQTYPLYKEISTATKKYYQWSNDNGTYTELGGIVEVSDGYFVFFAGEPDANGNSMNSSRIEKNTDARNLGFVKVKKDFEGYQTPKKDIFLSKGKYEKGGFYTFGGYWSELENYGVTWMTQYKNKTSENVKNIKVIGLPNDKTLIMWSKQHEYQWTDGFKQSTFQAVLNREGEFLINPIELGESVILNRRDDILRIGDKVFILDAKDNSLIINVLELDNSLK